MNVSYINRLKTATLSATNEDLNRPVTNIIHNFLELAFYSTGPNSVITITLDTDRDIDHIAFDYHNINTMTVRFYDNLLALIDTQVIDVQENCNFHYFDTVEDVLTITITVDTLGGLLYIGGISMGEYFELPDFKQSPGGDFLINDKTFKSTGGQKTGNRNFCPFTKVLNFVNISNNEKNNILTYLQYVQNSIPHFIDLYPDAQDYNKPFYGSMELNKVPIPKRRISTWEWDLSLKYEECR